MTNFKLATYAVDEDKSQGRLYQEIYDDSKYRSVFGRDRDRIINSSAFRRLQYKTQVFVNNLGDHYRTRLTHSLEVAQIARWIAGALEANKDLAEIVSLAHDLGHPPFGHAGEDALNECMKNYGGFSHNAHTLKIITKLETRFIEFEGLNLSWEMLEGVVKHNGPLVSQVPQYILEYDRKYNLDLENFSSIEAQISAIADDIAYNNHDLEDGLRANLFKIEDIFSLPVVGEIYKEILKKYPNVAPELIVGEAKKRLTLAMVIDVIDETKKNILENKIITENDVRNLGKSLVHFSKNMEIAHQSLKKFLMQNMYRHELVNKMTLNARKIVSSLFDFYMKNPDKLPEVEKTPLAISDYIAGMTDRFAISEYKKHNSHAE